MLGKKTILRIWPILSILLIWFLFSFPYFLFGKVPYSSTYQVNHFTPWSSYINLAGPVKNGAMPDVTSQIYPWKHFTIETLKSGQIPLWNPFSFSGTPHLGNYQSAVLTPFNLLFFIFKFIDAWSILILLQPLLAGIFMYLFVRSIKVSNVGSLISAIAFMFCGFITVWADYGTLAYAILFLPLSLFAIEEFYKSSKKSYLALLQISIPLSFLSGHFQISIYSFLFTIFYICYKFLVVKDFSKTKMILLFLFFGFLVSLPQILPSMDAYTNSRRSDIFIHGEAIPWAYLPTFLSPDFFGNPVTRNDWFGHYAEWNGFVGVVPLLLGIFAILKKRSPLVIFLALASAVSILMAFGSPLLDLVVFLRIPVLATSSASRIIVIFSFSFAVLAGLGFDNLLDEDGVLRNRLLPFFIPGLIMFSCLWVIVLLKLFLPLDKVSIAKSNLYLPTLLFLAASFLIFIAGNKRSKKIALSCLLLLVAFDMVRFATKWQPFDPKGLVFVETPITKYFEKIKGVDRVYGSFGAEDAVYYQLPSIEGYDAVYQQRYGELLASANDGTLHEGERSVASFPRYGKYAPALFNLLGIKYFVHKVSDDHYGWEFPYWTYPTEQFNQIYKDNLFEVYKNTKSYPRAFLAGQYIVEKDPQKIINSIFVDGINLRNTVILEEDPHIPKTTNPGTATITKYSPDEVDIKVNANNSSLLFLSDTYADGWKAVENGVDVPILRTDFALRSVVVGKGESVVKFVYQPISFTLGIIGALIGVFLGLFALVKLKPSSKETRG